MTDTYAHNRELTRKVLREAEGRPLQYSELAARGINNPGQAVYELELEGAPVMHVAGGVAWTPKTGAPERTGR